MKLNGDNYETWSLKVQYVLEEQEALEAINIVMDEPEEGTTKKFFPFFFKNSVLSIFPLENPFFNKKLENLSY